MKSNTSRQVKRFADWCIRQGARLKDWESYFQTELGVSAALAKKISESFEFVNIFNKYPRFYTYLKYNVPTKALQEQLLTALADDAVFAKLMSEKLDEAAIVVSKGNLNNLEFNAIHILEQDINTAMFQKGFERSFFAAGVFNSIVFKNHRALDADGLSKLNALRGNPPIFGTSQNGMLAEFTATNKTGVQTRGSHSGSLQSTGQSAVGTSPVPTDRRLGQFTHGGTDRWKDSESKFLEELIDRINSGELQGVSEIRLYSERPVCPSCANAINNFQNMFPKINFVVFEGKIIP